MKTAEELFRDKIKELHPHMKSITLSNVLITAEQGMRWAQEYSVLKARFHVEKALKQTSKKVICGLEYSHHEGEFEDIPVYEATVDKKSILNAYPLTNIK